MSVTKLTIKGVRGFSEEQTLRFAVPTGKIGSGITILVGPNNGGKSSVIESLQALSQKEASFSEGKRNKRAGDRINIGIEVDDSVHELRTVDAGGSETIREPENPPGNCYVLPSRRFFDPYFGSRQSDRDDYLRTKTLPDTRSGPIGYLSGRLFNALKNLTQFNRVLKQVVDPVPDWTIEQSDQGRYYLKMNYDGQFHNSDGLGEGIVSLLFIVDALYDSGKDDLIVLDEPELSLHPAYQRRLAKLLAEYGRELQIVYATHSPYFVDFGHVLNGAEVARVHKSVGSSKISQLKKETAGRFHGFLTDSHNPHALGLDAREVFFQDDGVIVVEGQEDVVYYRRILDDLAKRGMLMPEACANLRERFFGWGAGGADKVETIMELLHDLGFERVAGIFDNNRRELIPELQLRFSTYTFHAIPADDIRTKAENGQRKAIHGLLDENSALRAEYLEETGEIFNDIAGKLLENPARVE